MDWDSFHEKYEVDEPHEKVIEFHQKYLEGKGELKVLDLGCGRGRNAIYLAQNGLDVYGCDISENGIKALHEIAAKTGIKIETDVSDITSLPYDREFFDVVISVNVLNHGKAADIEVYFKEATRVLKPEGMLFIIGLGSSFINYVRKDDTQEIEPNTYVNIDTPDGDNVHHLFAEGELRRWLQNFEFLGLSEYTEHSPWLQKDVSHLQLTANR
jgi:2-polyprenyl-3-methyl-5-hydroxy-6-metoxy-1,4-benzoquinol methylase